MKAAAQPSRATDAAARQGAARDFGAMAAQFDGKLASQQAHFEGELARRMAANEGAVERAAARASDPVVLAARRTRGTMPVHGSATVGISPRKQRRTAGEGGCNAVEELAAQQQRLEVLQAAKAQRGRAAAPKKGAARVGEVVRLEGLGAVAAAEGDSETVGGAAVVVCNPPGAPAHDA